jgi:hypothetical protein
MNIGYKMSVIFKRGFKIHPIISSNKFAVQVLDQNRVLYNKGIATGEFKHTSKTINEGLSKMICHVYDNLKI